MALTCFIIPFLSKLYLFLIVIGVQGLVAAGVEVAVNAWILELWKEDCNIYMQGMHFSMSIGVLIAPTVAAQFLSEPVDNIHQVHHTLNNTLIGSDSSESLTSFDMIGHEKLLKTSEQWKKASSFNDLSQGLLVPYLITTIVLIISSILQAGLYFILPYSQNARTLRPPPQNKEERNSIVLTTRTRCDASTCEASSVSTDHPSTILTTRPKSYMTVMVISGCAITCFYCGLEMNSFIFLPDFAVALDYPKRFGAYLTAYMAVSYASFRFIGIFTAAKVKTVKMLFAHLSLIGVANVIIWYAANIAKSEFFLKLGVICLGAGCSCVNPAIYAYLESKITVTNGLCGLFMFTSSLATSINPIIEGRYLEAHPSIFIGINTVGFLCVLLILSMLEFTYRKKNK